MAETSSKRGADRKGRINGEKIYERGAEKDDTGKWGRGNDEEVVGEINAID